MIKIRIQKDHDYINQLIVKGHASAADAGEDLICAGVSCVCIGMLNALDELCGDEPMSLTCDDGYVEISDVTHAYNTQLLLKTLVVQLKAIEQYNPKFIKITIQEV